MVSPPPASVKPLQPATAWATAWVPEWKDSNSNTPTGPFQMTVPAFLMISARRPAVSGPMSRIISSGCTRSTSLSVAWASWWKRSAVSTSVGSGMVAPLFSAWIISSSAFSTSSGSNMDFPMRWPAAARKVLAMPPPTISWSTFSISASSTSSLPETLAPPTMATSGRAGLASALSSAATSRASSGPATAVSECRMTPSVEDWARWAVAKASITNTSHSAAIFFARSSSLPFSPFRKRTFSSSTTLPGWTSTPSIQSSTSSHGSPSNSPSFSATGASEYCASNSPSSGRPRCDITITAAPATSAWRMVGTEALMRASEVTLPSRMGTLRSARMRTRFSFMSTWSRVFISNKFSDLSFQFSGKCASIFRKPAVSMITPGRPGAKRKRERNPVGSAPWHGQGSGARDRQVVIRLALSAPFQVDFGFVSCSFDRAGSKMAAPRNHGKAPMIVRKLRLRNGWSQDQLAELADVSVRTIQRIERGHAPSLETANALAAVFEVNVTTFTLESDMSDNEELREEEIEAMAYAREVKDFLSGAVATYFVLAACLFISYGFDKPMLWVVFGTVGATLILQGLIGFEVIRLPLQKMERRLAEKKLGRKLEAKGDLPQRRGGAEKTAKLER